MKSDRDTSDHFRLLLEARREIDELRARSRGLEWKLDSIYATRAWRIAAVLRRTLRRPRTVLQLPRGLAGALARRPRPPAPVKVESGESPDAAAPEPSGPSGPHEPHQPQEPSRDIAVAVIAGERLTASLAPEWRQTVLRPETATTVLESVRPRLLIVETVGSGHEWYAHLRDGGSPLLHAVLAWCRDHDVPSVLWSTVDVKECDAFAEVATGFAHLFAVSPETATAYDPSTEVLPFAAQPRVHNPIRRNEHPRVDLAYLGDPWFDDLPVGSAPAAEVPAHHGRVLVAGANARDDSALPPEVFEYAATGTPILAIERPEGDQKAGGLAYTTDPDAGRKAGRDALVNLLGNAGLRDRLAHRARRAVLDLHTYGDRVDRILDTTGLETPDPNSRTTVSVLLATRRPEQLTHALDQVAAQHHRPIQLVLVLHGDAFDPDLVERETHRADLDHLDTKVLHAPESESLGQCLNRAVHAADGAYVAKMDDDDLYGPHHLSDLLATFAFTTAGVAGRGAHYVHFLGSGATVLRRPDAEHRYTHHVHGGTIMARTEVARRVRFPDRSVGEDTGFLAACHSREIPIYSADRFSYVWMRRPDLSGHSWRRTEAGLMADGRLEFFGRPEQHVLI